MNSSLQLFEAAHFAIAAMMSKPNKETSACVSLGKGFLLLAYSDFFKTPSSSYVAAMFVYSRHVLGVNKHTSNLAILSETGRFPMYFSIILSIVKYLHRLETTSNTLLKEAYSLSKELHNRGIQTWYSSAIYILAIKC